MHNFSPLETLPFSSKHDLDYTSIPVSKARQRKIEHLRKMLKTQSKGRALHHAIHNMRMFGNDIVAAMSE